MRHVGFLDPQPVPLQGGAVEDHALQPVAAVKRTPADILQQVARQRDRPQGSAAVEYAHPQPREAVRQRDFSQTRVHERAVADGAQGIRHPTSKKPPLRAVLRLLQLFKVGGAVLAQRADDIVRQVFALVDPAADLADPALFVGFGLGLDVVLIIGIGHGLGLGEDLRLGDGADEHAVGIEVHVLLDLQGHKGVDIGGQEGQAVGAAQGLDLRELVGGAPGLEAEGLEHAEGRVHAQAVDVHHARLFDDVVGIVLLVDAHGNAVRGVRDLRDGVHDQAVILGPVVGRDHVQAVADLEQGGQVVLGRDGFLHGGLVARGQLVGEGVELRFALVVQGGLDMHRVLGEGDILAALEQPGHHLGGKGRPASVFDQAHGLVLVAALGQRLDERAHEGEDIRVIGGGCKHQRAVAERVLHGLRHVAAGKVVHGDLGAAVRLQALHKLLHRLFRVAVDGGVAHADPLGLGAVGGPDIIEVEVVAEVLAQHGTVQRADRLNVQLRRLFQHGLHLRAVFAHDAEIIASGFARPVLLHVQRPELAEAVRREQDLVGLVIGHQDLRPVNHRRPDEVQGVRAEGERIALLDHDPLVRKVGAEKVAHHGERLRAGHHGRFGIGLQEVDDVRRVVGLHVLHDQIVGLAPRQRRAHVIQPFVGEVRVHRVHDRDFFIPDHVGIVRHAVRHVVLPLEQVDPVVVHADVDDVVGNKHNDPPFMISFFVINLRRGLSGIRRYPG